MEFEVWEPVYEQIRSEFGYGRAGDEQARDVLATLYREQITGDADQTVTETLRSLDFSGESVAIAGGADSLDGDLDTVDRADVVIGVSNAATRLQELGYRYDCMVTDLDKSPETAGELSRRGVPVFVHAHGDNIDLLETYVPKFDAISIVPTTQVRPVGPVLNFGGFTDGDRAAFIADEVNAKELHFPGWDFEDETVSPEKRRKLVWAGRLLCWLERRRNERFDVLDGLRDRFDTESLADGSSDDRPFEETP